MLTKDSVLKFLEENRGVAVSGNGIAKSLCISRTAVWKAVNQLKDEGYPIDAANKRGYTLNTNSDLLSPQSIAPFLLDKELFDIKVYKSITSTNDEAKALAAAGAPSCTVIIAEQQTKGRGRMGRSFYAPSGEGLYMSLLLRPDAPLEQTMLMTSAAAVAVCRAIKMVCGLSCSIKWVNDVYLDGKKLCGILTEGAMGMETRGLEYIVVGIGINISVGAFPSELLEVATSLSSHTSGIVSRSALAGAILNELVALQNDLIEKQFLSEYRSLSCILGSKINIIASETIEKATALDIDENGYLLVVTEAGERKTLNNGEISIRKL